MKKNKKLDINRVQYETTKSLSSYFTYNRQKKYQKQNQYYHEVNTNHNWEWMSCIQDLARGPTIWCIVRSHKLFFTQDVFGTWTCDLSVTWQQLYPSPLLVHIYGYREIFVSPPCVLSNSSSELFSIRLKYDSGIKVY